MIKIAIVGTGIIVASHLKAIKETEGITLAALCDINPDAVKKYADEYNVPAYTDYKDMAENESIDAVILNLPHFLHCEASEFFLGKDIHVLCEKPMANTMEECDRMIEAEKNSKARLAIGHVQRYFPVNMMVKKYVDEGTLGELCMITDVRNTWYFSDTRPKWFLQKKLSGGGILMNFGAHALDKFSYIVGNNFSDIKASCDNFFEGYDVEGHAQVKIKINDRVSAVMTFCSYPSVDESETTYYFTNGAVKIGGAYGFAVCTEPNGLYKKMELPKADAIFAIQLKEFIKFINGEEANIADSAYSRKIIEVIENSYSQNK